MYLSCLLSDIERKHLFFQGSQITLPDLYDFSLIQTIYTSKPASPLSNRGIRMRPIGLLSHTLALPALKGSRQPVR